MDLITPISTLAGSAISSLATWWLTRPKLHGDFEMLLRDPLYGAGTALSKRRFRAEMTPDNTTNRMITPRITVSNGPGQGVEVRRIEVWTKGARKRKVTDSHYGRPLPQRLEPSASSSWELSFDDFTRVLGDDIEKWPAIRIVVVLGSRRKVKVRHLWSNRLIAAALVHFADISGQTAPNMKRPKRRAVIL